MFIIRLCIKILRFYKIIWNTFKLVSAINFRFKKNINMLRHFGKSDEKSFWIFEEILHDEAERVKQLNGV